MERVAKAMYPGTTVMPSMSTGARDQAQLQREGHPVVRHRPRLDEADAPELSGARRR